MERHFELRPLLQVAGVAKLGLRLDEQKFGRSGMVRRMARGAGNIILRVHRVDGMHLLRARCVAGEALRVDFFCGRRLELEELGSVGGIRDVFSGRAMAPFAALF